MGRLTHDEYFLQMLELVAARSTCVRRAVGAILVDEGGHVLSTGYNGVPRGVPHCIDAPCAGVGDKAGDSSRCESIHAEINAILQCARLDLAHTLYVSCTPCFTCAKMICNTQIKRIICHTEYADTVGLTMMARCGIQLIVVAKDRLPVLDAPPTPTKPKAKPRQRRTKALERWKSR